MSLFTKREIADALAKSARFWAVLVRISVGPVSTHWPRFTHFLLPLTVAVSFLLSLRFGSSRISSILSGLASRI